MINRMILSALLVAVVVADANAQNRFHRRRGAILGGLAGAALGVAIGDKGGNETAGALIGGAVGAFAGGSIGNQKDRRIEDHYRHAQQTRVYRQQLSQQQSNADWQAQQFAQQQMAQEQRQRQEQQQASRALSIEDVVTMVGSGLAESTIVQYVRVNGVQYPLRVADIISLHDQGVSEAIINAMQTAPVASAGAMPIIVEGQSYSTQSPVLGTAIPEVTYESNRSFGPPLNSPGVIQPIVDPTKPWVFPAGR